DDDVPKDGVFSINSFDDENTDKRKVWIMMKCLHQLPELKQLDSFWHFHLSWRLFSGARRRDSDVVMMIMEFSTLKRRKAAGKDSYTAEWWFCFECHGYYCLVEFVLPEERLNAAD
ncbi:hypothetical protein Tco_1497593, partial [Tanacetum coccineum]